MYKQAMKYFRFIILPSFSTGDEVGTGRQDFCAKISDRKLGRDARVEEWDTYWDIELRQRDPNR